jgi:hypothetical protein
MNCAVHQARRRIKRETTTRRLGWWADKHHRYHAHPNQEGCAPDNANDVIRRH